MKLKLRPAVFKDWETLLEWRNDSSSRKNSFKQEQIDEQSHKTWLISSLSNPDRTLLIMEDSKGLPLGTVRCDTIASKEKVLSWTINPNYRKKGLGKSMLELFLKGSKEDFTAKIKKENIGSIKMAESNGFKHQSGEIYKRIFESK